MYILCGIIEDLIIIICSGFHTIIRVVYRIMHYNTSYCYTYITLRLLLVIAEDQREINEKRSTTVELFFIIREWFLVAISTFASIDYDSATKN